MPGGKSFCAGGAGGTVVKSDLARSSNAFPPVPERLQLPINPREPCIRPGMRTIAQVATVPSDCKRSYGRSGHASAPVKKGVTSPDVVLGLGHGWFQLLLMHAHSHLPMKSRGET